MMKYTLKIVWNNLYLLLGICVGVLIPLNFERCLMGQDGSEAIGSIEAVLKVQNITRRQVETKLIRPRYYSTELGMREKLFVGVMSSEERILTQVVHVNKTTQHLVDKIKFFITATQNFKHKYNFSGIVGFTDTRRVFRPFQIVKYVSDSFDDFDFYFLARDYNYIDGRKLRTIVEGISVSSNVYLGTVKDGSFCDLDSGILFSNSILKAVQANLDWCIKNVVSDDDSENLGRCVYYSTKLTCQGNVQGQEIKSFKLKRFNLSDNLSEVKDAVTVFPILTARDYHVLHAFFSREHLKEVKREIRSLSKTAESWPPGQRTGTKPSTRFDLPQTIYFNETHNFFPDHFTNVRKLTRAELKDLDKILNEIIKKTSRDFGFRRIVNGYRTFQLSRGLDYRLDLEFRDLKVGKDVIKRFEVCKPLGNVEFLTKPYTTENTKLYVLLPIQEHEIHEAYKFLNEFVSGIMDKREKVVLMFALLYGYDSSNKGEDDVFKKIKEIAIEVSRRYHSEDTKAAWISIRLPNEKDVTTERFPSLNFAIIDLSLRKLGLDALILYLDVYSRISVEFLNRVRMNTIQNYQIFSPIPFRQYNPNVTSTIRMEIHKTIGQFDKEEYGYISFYGKDYVKARKLHDRTLPIVRTDNDVSNVIDENHKNIGNVFEMFVRHSEDYVHKMRAIDAALFVRYRDLTGSYGTRNNLFLGNKAQLAKIILDHLEVVQKL